VAHQEDAEQSVRDVYEACSGRLIGWVTELVDDREAADLIAAESFVRLLRHWDTVEDPEAWLYTASGNQVRDHWRKQGRLRPDPSRPLTVRTALDRLPQKLRMTVLLHYFADLPVARVSKQLRRSEAAITRDLADARQVLAEYLEPAS
jgi:DNA-directed RNA polymerase specialized sigma24 family protein